MSVALAYSVLAHKSKSFALAARLLPRAFRDDVAVLYAYCRRADDAVDEAPAAEQPERVRWLFAELASIYAGEAQADPLLVEFQRLIARCQIPEALPRALLDGMHSDVGAVRIRTWAELVLYAHRVAGVVGIMLCHVWGVKDPDALERANHLGIALQLTNICRDVAEDLERDRLYLPTELLRDCGAAPPHEQGALLGTRWAPPACALKRVLDVADRFYASGDAGLSFLSFRVAFAVRTARLVYAAIGRQLRVQGYDIRAGRAVVPARTKLWLAVRAFSAECTARLATRRRLAPALARRTFDAL